MRWLEGPGNDLYWGGENSSIPAWVVVLPQGYGQAVITASIRGMDNFTSKIHEGLPKTNKGLGKRSKFWTRTISNKLLDSAIDIAISTKRFERLDVRERQAVQEYLHARSMYKSARSRRLPNLANAR